MESNRTKHQVNRHSPRGRQAGMTVIGILFMVAVFGTIGFAVLRIVPLYLERMRITTVLNDVGQELGTGSNTVGGIRNAVDSRLYIEAIELAPSELEITREADGYLVHIHREIRAEFLAGLWFLVIVDEQTQVSR